ncbi:MAG: ferrous iron transport protein A [Defluviitaleaceae bacterium]|nr:ferrous iron transport protein A [Defluviitaleaceae bacterium]
MPTPTNLYNIKTTTPLQVISVPKNELLENMGIRIGTYISIKTRYKLGGPVLLSVEDSYAVAVGKDIAEQIFVKESA